MVFYIKKINGIILFDFYCVVRLHLNEINHFFMTTHSLVFKFLSFGGIHFEQAIL